MMWFIGGHHCLKISTLVYYWHKVIGKAGISAWYLWWRYCSWHGCQDI